MKQEALNKLTQDKIN